MAILNICGFETGDLTELFSTSGTCSISSSTKRTGGYSFRTNPTTTGTGAGILKALGTNGVQTDALINTAYVRFYFSYATKPSSNEEIFFGIKTNGGTLKCSIRLDSNGNIKFYDSGTTLRGTGSTVLSSDTWYRIEVKCGNQAFGAGEWEVKINGASEISGSTANLLTTQTSYIQLGKITNINGKTVDWFFDDISWSSSAYPGGGAVLALLPNANGNYQEFSPSDIMASNHYSLVDEVPPNGDTDYVSNTFLAQPKFETEALVDSASAGISGNVNAVKSVLVVKRQGLSNGLCRVLLRSGSTDDITTSDYISTSSYGMLSKLYETDPNTSSSWTLSGLDSVETGIKDTHTNGSRMTFTCAMVDFTASTQSPIPRCLTIYRRRRNKI